MARLDSFAALNLAKITTKSSNFFLAKKWNKNYICFRKRKKKKKTRNVISPMNRWQKTFNLWLGRFVPPEDTRKIIGIGVRRWKQKWRWQGHMFFAYCLSAHSKMVSMGWHWGSSGSQLLSYCRALFCFSFHLDSLTLDWYNRLWHVHKKSRLLNTLFCLY